MTPEEYTKQFKEDDAVGWLAIDKKIEEVYGKTEPRHYASIMKYALGGPDPIDGSSIFDSSEQEFHRHIITYGMSELYYNEAKAGGDFSGFGFEFTMRIKSTEGEEEPKWAISLMNNLARYVFDTGNCFEEYHYIPTNSPIKLGYETDLVGILFITDPELGKISTPHGEVTFLQLVGITAAELERITTNPAEVEKLVEELRMSNPLLITDLDRKG